MAGAGLVPAHDFGGVAFVAEVVLPAAGLAPFFGVLLLHAISPASAATMIAHEISLAVADRARPLRIAPS
jgi:hypothetical protein